MKSSLELDENLPIFVRKFPKNGNLPNFWGTRFFKKAK
jgi:hypothetical protein